MTEPAKDAAMKFPPPLIFALGLLVGFATTYFIPTPFVRFTGSVGFGSGLIVIGLAAIVFSGRTFRRSGTTVLPGQPANRFVIVGPYRYSRNPIYAGMSSVYLGIAILLHSLWIMVLLPAVLGVLFRTVVRSEEEYLERRFGDEYITYKRSVRRWL